MNRATALEMFRRYRGEFKYLKYLDRRAVLEACGDGLNLCEAYGDDPVAFGQEVLGEGYTEDVKSFMRSVVANDRVIARSANAVGKSHGCGALVVWHALCKPGSQTWICAAPPEENLLSILWPSVERRYWAHKYLFDARGWEINSLRLQRPWTAEDGRRGSEDERPIVRGVRIPIAGSPKQREAKFSGKHARNLMFVVDEGDAVPDEVYLGIDACMSGGDVRLVVTFNPRDQSGPVWEMERKGMAHVQHLSAFRHPNVQTGRDIVPGAVTQQITVRRIQEWTEPCKRNDEDPTVFVVPEFLEGVVASRGRGGHHVPLAAGYRRIIDPQFAYKVLGIYSPVSTFDQVFDRAFLLRLEEDVKKFAPVKIMEAGRGLAAQCVVYEEPQSGRGYIITADPAEGNDPDHGDYSVFDVWDTRQWRQVAHYSGRIDPHTFAGDLAAVGLYYNSAEIVVERNNHGHAVLEALTQTHEYPMIWQDKDQRQGMPSNVKTKAMRVAAMSGMLTAMRAGAEKGIEFRSPDTIAQMLTYGRLGGGRMGGKYNANDDCVTTACMAAYIMDERRGYDAGRIELAEPLVLY